MYNSWRTVVKSEVKVVTIALLVSMLFGMLSCGGNNTTKNGIVSSASMDELPEYFYAEFRANEEVAKWLLIYDHMAWLSSDVVIQEPQEELNELGPEWFCLESGGNWHAVYGRYDTANDTYHVVFHYVYHENSGFIPTDEVIAENTLALYGRALNNSLKQFPESITSIGVSFNKYIRRMGDGNIEVWFLPGGQQDGTLVYGGDLLYVLDSTGSKILDEKLNFTRFYAIRPGSDVELDINREENNVPGVGDIFFLFAFRDKFKDVMVWTRCFTTKMLDVKGKESSWLHIKRPGIDCTSDLDKQPNGDVEALD